MKKLFTSLAICMVLTFTTFSCTDQDEPQNIEVIQAELDAFITSEMKKSDGRMTPKIMNFLAKKGFIQVTEGTPEYVEMMEVSAEKLEEDGIKMFKLKSSSDLSLSDMVRILDCVVTGSGAMVTGGDCWVAVYEYSSGCFNSGCVQNSWWCGGEYQGSAMYC